MGIIRNHLLQMKEEQPLEYLRLMRGYESEDHFVCDALGLSTKAYNHYKEVHHVHTNDAEKGETNECK